MYVSVHAKSLSKGISDNPKIIAPSQYHTSMVWPWDLFICRLLSKNTTFISFHVARWEPISYHHAISENLFLYWRDWGLVNLVAAFDRSDWRAVLEIGAGDTFSHTTVRSARLRDKATCFSKDPVENSPATLASFCQVITIDNVLWRQITWVFSKLGLDSRLNNLDETHCVAASTHLLIPYRASKIISRYIT